MCLYSTVLPHEFPAWHWIFGIPYIWVDFPLCVSSASMESMFTLIMLSAVVSGMPSSAYPFSGTTENSHFLLLFLCTIITAHVCSWVMNVLLYIFNFMWFLMVFMSWDSVTLRKNFLNIYQGIIFPSLPVSILYGITMLLLHMHICNLAVSIDQFLVKHTELILTISRLSSVYSCDTSLSISLTILFFLLQQTFGKCLNFIAICAHLAIHWALPWLVDPPQYLHGCRSVLWCTDVLALFSFTFLDSFISSNCIDSINVFNTAAWALCASTLLAHASTPPLVIQSSFFVAVNSFIISSNIHLSFRPWINCSLSCLLTSW